MAIRTVAKNTATTILESKIKAAIVNSEANSYNYNSNGSGTADNCTHNTLPFPADSPTVMVTVRITI